MGRWTPPPTQDPMEQALRDAAEARAQLAEMQAKIDSAVRGRRKAEQQHEQVSHRSERLAANLDLARDAIASLKQQRKDIRRRLYALDDWSDELLVAYAEDLFGRPEDRSEADDAAYLKFEAYWTRKLQDHIDHYGVKEEQQ